MQGVAKTESVDAALKTAADELGRVEAEGALLSVSSLEGSAKTLPPRPLLRGFRGF